MCHAVSIAVAGASRAVRCRECGWPRPHQEDVWTCLGRWQYVTTIQVQTSRRQIPCRTLGL